MIKERDVNKCMLCHTLGRGYWYNRFFICDECGSKMKEETKEEIGEVWGD